MLQLNNDPMYMSGQVFKNDPYTMGGPMMSGTFSPMQMPSYN